MKSKDDTDREDRRERYERRHGQPQKLTNDQPKKRRDPYKRQQLNFNTGWDEDDDEWFDDNT